MDKPPPRPKAPATTLHITENLAGLRLDRLLKTQFPAVPFAGLHKLLRTGQVRLNGTKTKPDVRVNLGDVLTLPGNVASQTRRGGLEKSGAYTPSGAELKALQTYVLHEDAQLLVLNKPAGLAAQAGSGIVKSLDRLLAAAYPHKIPKLTHRLDRATTGVIVAAKNRTSAAHVAAQFAAKTTHKTYALLVVGQLPKQGEMREPIAKAGAKAFISSAGDAAHTSWVKYAEFKLAGQVFSLVAAQPHTGRMNQLRVHFAHAGRPLVGDDKYSSPDSRAASAQLAEELGLSGTPPLFLHAASLVLAHPADGARRTFYAPLPPHFSALTPHVGAATLAAFTIQATQESE